MSRVTKRDENGMLFVGGLSWLEVIRALTHAMSKLEQYERCGHITQFEADGPMENGRHVCPSCVSMITPEPEDEEDDET